MVKKWVVIFMRFFFNSMSLFFNKYKKKFKISSISIVSIVSFYLLFFNYVELHEVTINRNFISGETYIDTIPGPQFSPPWVFVCGIDTRPSRICITSASRNFNCTLVSFDPSGWEEFVHLEGFYYYWWANRLSINMGHNQEYRGMYNLIRGYTFDKTKRSFIKVHQEYGK